MATMANMAMARMRADRIFYSAVPMATAAVVFTGFARSWFLRPFGTLPAGYGPLTALLVVHGTLFTLWMALAVTQPLYEKAADRKLTMDLLIEAAGQLQLHLEAEREEFSIEDD